MTCKTNVARKHWFAVTILGAMGADIDEGINATAYSTLLRQVSNSLAWTDNYSQDEGHNGTPWFDASSVELESGASSGNVVMEPRFGDLKAILPLLMDGTFSGNNFSPALTGYCRFFKAGRGLGIVQKDFMNCKTTEWSMAASSGAPRLQLNWGIAATGINRTGDGSAPALSYSVLPPLMHVRSTITIDGRAIPVDDVTITGNNGINPLRYNTVGASDLLAGRQTYSFTCTSPFDDADDIGWFDIGRTSVVASFEYIDAADDLSMTINFPAVQPIIPTPESPAAEAPVQHRGIVWTARSATVGAAPINFVVDDTV